MRMLTCENLLLNARPGKTSHVCVAFLENAAMLHEEIRVLQSDGGELFRRARLRGPVALQFRSDKSRFYRNKRQIRTLYS